MEKNSSEKFFQVKFLIIQFFFYRNYQRMATRTAAAIYNAAVSWVVKKKFKLINQ